MLDQVVLQFSTSNELSSKLIRMLSHSPFSHVDLVVAEGLLGASDSPRAPVVNGNPRGVAVRPRDYMAFGIRRQAVIKTDKADKIVTLAYSQVGKPFDADAISPSVFMSDSVPDERWKDPDKWFCAELMAWCFEGAGYWGHELIWPKNRITPTDFLLLFVTDPNFVNRAEFWRPIGGIKLGEREL